MNPSVPIDAGRLSAEAAFAVRAAAEAWAVLRSREDVGPRGRHDKADRTPVTSLDFVVQAVILALLEDSFPDDVFLAEEDGAGLPARQVDLWVEAAVAAVRRVRPGAASDDVRRWLGRRPAVEGSRFWTIDPIDGTKGMLRGGQFVSALSLVEDGQAVLGVLACPRYLRFGPEGCLAFAARGRGAWVVAAGDTAWKKLDLSQERRPAAPRLIRSVEDGRLTARRLAHLRRDLDLDAVEVRLDSQIKYLALAAGEGEVLVRWPRRGGALQENTWDHAAGTLLVEEAGGRVTDLRGHPLDFGGGVKLDRNVGVLSAVPALHPLALRAVATALERVPSP